MISFNSIKQSILYVLFAAFCLVACQTSNAQAVVTFFHNDISGTPMVATDAAGNVVWKESHKPYGEKLRNEPASRDGKNKIGFAGSPFDTSTGLSYMGARYYDPVIGRFMGIDPVGFQENNIHSFNRYAYANNNPYKYIDRNGKYAELAIEAISLTVGFKSLIANLQARNYGAAAVDGAGIVTDAVGAAIPVAPGVAGLGIQASRQITTSGTQGASQVLSREIGNGHAFVKHVVQKGEFKGLDIRTREQFISHVENVVNNPTAKRDLSGGRTGY